MGRYHQRPGVGRVVSSPGTIARPGSGSRSPGIDRRCLAAVSGGAAAGFAPQRFGGAGGRQPAGRLPSAGATKALRLKPPCSPAGHGCKAPSTNARTARPATWPSNGARTAHDPANAWALVVSAHAAVSYTHLTLPT